MDDLISSENIIVYQAQGQESIGEVITQLFPNVKNQGQLYALYRAVVIMNRHSGFLEADQNESINFEKILAKNSCIIFPSYDSLIYKNIFESDSINIDFINFIATLNNNQYRFIETNEAIKENLSQTMSAISLINMVATAEAIHELGKLVNPSYNEKIEALIQKANCTPDNPTGLPEFVNDLNKQIKNETSETSFKEGLFSTFKEDWLKEYSKEGVNGIATIMQHIEFKVRELDHLLIQYAHAKGKTERQRLKSQVIAARNKLNKIVPSILKESVNNVLKRTAKRNIKKNPKNAAMSKTYLNFNKALKAADKARNSTQKLNALLNLHASQVHAEKSAGFFERYYGKNKKSSITWKKLIDRKVTGSLILRNSEYKNYLGHMAKASKYVGKGLFVFDLFSAFYTVYEAYSNDQNWKKVAVVEASGLVVGVLAGIACGYTIGPLAAAAPPVSTILVPVSCVAVGIAGGFVGKLGGEIIYDSISKEDQQFIIENGFIHANQ